MGDPRQNVRPGEPLRIAAEQINYLNSLMRGSGGFAGQGPEGWPSGINVVMAKNTTGAAVPRWGVLGVENMLEISPQSGYSQEASFQEMPCVRGGVPTADTAGRFVIALEPIPLNGIGRAAAAGVVAVKLHIVTAGDGFARPKPGTVSEMISGGGPAEILWKQSGTGTGKWALIKFGGGGTTHRLCKSPSESFPKGTIKTLAVWEDGTPPGETQTSAAYVHDVVNKYADIVAGKWVSVALHGNGRWYVVSAEC